MEPKQPKPIRQTANERLITAFRVGGAKVLDTNLRKLLIQSIWAACLLTCGVLSLDEGNLATLGWRLQPKPITFSCFSLQSAVLRHKSMRLQCKYDFCNLRVWPQTAGEFEVVHACTGTANVKAGATCFTPSFVAAIRCEFITQAF